MQGRAKPEVSGVVSVLVDHAWDGFAKTGGGHAFESHGGLTQNLLKMGM